MTTPTPDRPFTLGRVAPMIPVSDLARARTFYVDVLGFEVVFENGDPVGFQILERDAAELHLTLQPGHRGTTTNVAHLMVEHVAAFHDHCTAHGVRIVKGIRDADYGMRTFVMADPDGNRIDVGENL